MYECVRSTQIFFLRFIFVVRTYLQRLLAAVPAAWVYWFYFVGYVNAIHILVYISTTQIESTDCCEVRAFFTTHFTTNLCDRQKRALNGSWKFNSFLHNKPFPSIYCLFLFLVIFSVLRFLFWFSFQPLVVNKKSECVGKNWDKIQRFSREKRPNTQSMRTD